MRTVAGRLFLLLLLACDWAAETPLSGALTSTECVCQSGHCQGFRVACSPAPQAGPACVHAGCPPEACLGLLASGAPPARTDRLVYVLMSIRR
jgi:hypothetical protein